MNSTTAPYLQRCIFLAQQGIGYTAPNPMVGAVLVYEDKIIGEGWHQAYGGPHAEVHCIEAALQDYPDKISQATLYVSLEPCSHHGKTPPCADLIIRHHIPKVVIASNDPFAAVNGTGIAKLEAAGIEVVLVEMPEARWLNRHFFTAQEKQRPYILLKWAMTQDGIMGTGTTERLLISNDMVQRYVHQWRTQYQSILVGANTIIQDNPLLNVRKFQGQQPLILVLDSNASLNNGYNIFQQGIPVWLFTKNATEAYAQQFDANVRIVHIDAEDFLKAVMDYLFTNKIISILVEGGSQTLQSFIQADLWDETIIVQSSKSYGKSGIIAPSLPHRTLIQEQKINSDKLYQYAHPSNAFYL